jgi:hypothetical protein
MIVNEKGQPNFKYEQSEELKSDPEIQVGKNKVKYSDITNAFPINKQEPIRILIYWDDICQYTSLGLIEVLNSVFKLNAKINIEHFLTRPNEYISGMDYVYKLFNKSLTKEQINLVKKRFYWKILELSLRSSLFMSITKINTFYNSIGFYFPYEFKNNLSLKAGLQKIFTNNGNQLPLEFYYESNHKSINEILFEKNYNTIVTPNVINTYNYIIDHDLKRISIIGPEDHNGFDDELYKVFSKMKNLPKPNYCSVDLYKEQIAV